MASIIEIKQEEKPSVRRITDIVPGIEFTSMHGNAFSLPKKRNSAHSLQPQMLVTECYEEARKQSYATRTMKAHEYEEDPKTLRLKVEKLAELILNSKRCVAYAGAGLSTGAGIQDYASSSTSVVNTTIQKKEDMKSVLPGLSHRVLYALHCKGHLPELIQQNHDGLPQKAGFPQHCVNEIHGAWFDPSNPVITMSGHLRNDLTKRFDRWKKRTDLVLALGTSLAATGADSIVDAVCKMQQDGAGDFGGAVIISLQQTYYDDVCALRIFGKLDEVLGMLAEHMKLQLQPAGGIYSPRVSPSSSPAPHVFRVPYDAVTGERSSDNSCLLWDLTVGSRLKIVYGPGDGFIGTVLRVNGQGHYIIEFPRIVAHNDEWLIRRTLKKWPNEDPRAPREYTMGCWWVESAVKGLCDRLPFVPYSGIDGDVRGVSGANDKKRKHKY